jgi:WD40 repeat protein
MAVVLAFVITVFVLQNDGATPPASGSSGRSSGTGATGEYSGTLTGSGGVVDVAFSHDSTMVATAGGNNHTVTLWDANTGKQIRIMLSCCVVSAVSFSPDDRRIATDGDLFEVATGTHLHELVGSGYSAAFSADGSFLAVASGYDPNLGTEIFDPSTGQPIRRLSNEYASYVAVSPDSTIVASATGYLAKGVRLWRASDGHLIRTLAGGSDRVAFSSAGNLIATSGNGSIQVWNAATGALIRDIHAAQVLAFGRNGSLFATDGNGAVRVYDPSNGDMICTVDGLYAEKAALSPDGIRIVALTPNGSAVLAIVSQNCLRRR